MSRAQQRGLALWAGLLSAILCLAFLPLSLPVAIPILLAALVLIAVVYRIMSRRDKPDPLLPLGDLPAAAYRQPVVLVCGDLPQGWPAASPVLTVSHGCWIRVDIHHDLVLVAREVLWQRPGWGRQLSVMVSVCPQQHGDHAALTSRLLALRWKISQLRRETGYRVPLVLNAQVGSTLVPDIHWQAAIPGAGVCVLRPSCAPAPVAAWVATGGGLAMAQQVLINSLINWFYHHVNATFIDETPDMPALAPAAVLWGMGPILSGCLASSVWTAWLTQHTALHHVAAWQPAGNNSTVLPLLPDVILPFLPQGEGVTPGTRTWRGALGLFTLAAIAALLCSGWNNRQLLQHLSVDIAYYHRIPLEDHRPKAAAVQVLRQHVSWLDDQARRGIPVRLGLGLYQGERLRLPLLEAIRAYMPPPAPQPVPVQPVPDIIRLNGMSLFESGQSQLKPGTSKILISALVGIKARPGWLIVVAGHTDNTGSPVLNQVLSRKRAEAVRDWMRDSGDVPENCFAVQGYGASRPVATNDTPEGRALNRRVDISLVPQGNTCLLPDTPREPSQDDGPSPHNGA